MIELVLVNFYVERTKSISPEGCDYLSQDHSIGASTKLVSLAAVQWEGDESWHNGTYFLNRRLLHRCNELLLTLTIDNTVTTCVPLPQPTYPT
jgi:hypothetical protein